MKHSLVIVLLLLGLPAVGQGRPADSGAAAPPNDPNATPLSANSKVDPTKEADIRQLIQLTGADKLADQMMSTMEANLKPGLMNAFPPGEYREKLVTLFFEKIHSKAIVGIQQITIPAYDKYFTDEEIREMIAFYQTPIGKKAVTVMPQLMNDVLQATQSWSQQLGRESLQEVLQEHPDLKQAMEEAEKKSKSQ
jgi:hypothetical protein